MEFSQGRTNFATVGCQAFINNNIKINNLLSMRLLKNQGKIIFLNREEKFSPKEMEN
jgi:hypothetical protein